MPAADADAVAAAIGALLGDDPACGRVSGVPAIATAAEYAWERRIDALESFLTDVAAPRQIVASTDVVPERARGASPTLSPPPHAMKTEFAVSKLRCPICRRDRTLRLSPWSRPARGARGHAALPALRWPAPRPSRRRGAVMVDAPGQLRPRGGRTRAVRRRRMRDDGLDRRRGSAGFHDLDDGYWYVAGRVDQPGSHTTIPFQPAQSLLDIGSNTCWASNCFAVRGWTSTALDIALWELQGLYTADYFIEEDTRTSSACSGSMNDMPLAADSFDYVYACEVLHHNDAEALRRDVRGGLPGAQAGREDARRQRDAQDAARSGRRPCRGRCEYEGYEHAHWAAQYRWGAIRAGFSTRLLEPVLSPLLPRRACDRCAAALRSVAARIDTSSSAPTRGATVPVLGQQRRRWHAVRHDRHQAGIGPRHPAGGGRRGSEVLGDVRRGPVEDEEPEPEARPARCRPGSPAPPDRRGRARARRRVVDDRVAELLKIDRQRVEHVQVHERPR